MSCLVPPCETWILSSRRFVLPDLAAAGCSWLFWFDTLDLRNAHTWRTGVFSAYRLHASFPAMIWSELGHTLLNESKPCKTACFDQLLLLTSATAARCSFVAGRLTCEQQCCIVLSLPQTKKRSRHNRKAGSWMGCRTDRPEPVAGTLSHARPQPPTVDAVESITVNTYPW